MSLRGQTRSWLIQAAALLRADALAMRCNKLAPHSQALVVEMHETPARHELQLRRQLQWASRHFTICRLEDFAKLWTPNAPSNCNSKPLLLFTFDDGRESNYSIAAPLLESFGARGVFFIVPAFAELAGKQNSASFYLSRMNPNSKPGDESVEDWKPMSPDQIADLAARGHAIGNHSTTHRRLVNLSPETMQREIVDSARQLASWTGRSVDAFAWTFGWDAIDRSAWELIQRYHRFCFSPCAGIVDAKIDQPSLLWRREIEARYSPAEYRFSYSGLVDLWWTGRRARLRKMLHP